MEPGDLAWTEKERAKMERRAAYWKARYEALVPQVERLEHSRQDLQARNKMLTDHDDCKWRHQVKAQKRTIETLVSQIRGRA